MLLCSHSFPRFAQHTECVLVDFNVCVCVCVCARVCLHVCPELGRERTWAWAAGCIPLPHSFSLEQLQPEAFLLGGGEAEPLTL
jgi:hypothetical protein